MASDASFFVSYAHGDAAYVTRLADHLRAADLPVWYDADIGWGQRFTSEIRQRIQDALALIVIMSPAAEQSEWVEREILEGQRHDRVFLPVLYRGERLFLLASSQYFDARDGRLPTEREIRQLRRIRDRHVVGTGTPAAAGPLPLVLPTAPGPAAPAGAMPFHASLEKLRAFLAAGDVEHADILTTSLLLAAAGRLDQGWLRRVDGRHLPADELAAIDEAWAGFSEGKQGFRAQLACHPQPPPGAPPGGQRDFVELALALGWKSSPHEVTPRYGQFVGPVDRVAFFPTLRNPQLERHQIWYDQWVETVMAVHFRLRGAGG